MPLEAKTTQLELDGRWGLEELSDTIKDYIQLYGFAYSLIPDLSSAKQSEINYIYGKFPWRGGFSTVNFFNQLFHKIPQGLRPEVKKIQYASPGFIELTELLAAATIVATIVGAICRSIKSVHDLYRDIQKASIAHKLSQINLANEELNATEKQLEFCERSSNSLIKAFDLTKDQENLINQRAHGNPIMKLKILLSVYRRAYPLAEKQSEKKLKISGKEKSQSN